MAALDELLAYIFDGEKPTFYAEFESWVRGSRRFRAFAQSNRGKIRAKLKSARDEGGRLDVRAELHTALLLLREQRFTLAYETYVAARQRGPDFTVTFKTHTLFNVEVRRIRSAELRNGGGNARMGKLMAVLCDKVGQMPASIVNLLWLVAGETGEGELTEAEVEGAATALRQLAEQKTEDFFTRRGFVSAAGFLKQYGRLSGIVVGQSPENVVWLNPLARHQAPPEIVTAVQRLGTV
jgi:hypothetical protein